MVALSNLPFKILLNKKAKDNFIYAYHVIDRVEGAFEFVQAQIQFTLDNLSSHLKWCALHDQDYKHLNHLEDLDEDAKYKATSSLD